MPFDGSGNFNRVRNWVSDALANIKIVASRHDSEDDNFAAGLSQCITKDGQTQPTADIPMNGKKLINLAAPSTGTDAANKTYVDTADNLKAPIASPTFTGKVTLPTGAAAGAGLRLPVVTANPTTPVAGDVWPDLTTGAWKYRLTASTLTFAAAELAQTWTAQQTFSAGVNVNGGQVSITTTAGQAIGVSGGPAANTSAILINSFAGAGNASFLSFNRNGAFAANFGIDTDNTLKWGGWSLGANAYKLLTENLATGTFVGAFTWSGQQTFSLGPIVPTAALNTNTTQAASTAFVQAAKPILGTATQATTSGTSIDFTGIPSWAKKVTLAISALSTNGSSNPMLQIGPAAGPETTGYAGFTGASAGGVNAGHSNGALLSPATGASDALMGVATWALVDASTNTWAFSWAGGVSSGFGLVGGGTKSIAGPLTQVRLTTAGGTATFDGGKAVMTWE